MESFSEFLNALGGLHDATVVSVEWQVEAKTLRFVFDDLYANFRGLPEYPGRRQGTILLQGLSQVTIDLDSNERLRVFEFLPVEGRPDSITVKFSPGGHLTARFAGIEHPANELVKESDMGSASN